jgi:hypothetical protein
MTTVLNFGNSTSSNPVPCLEGASSLFSNLKLPTTFIIQPPSTQPRVQPLLVKRYKASELGDLLMKKIKTQTFNSDSNSNQQSPTFKDNSEDNVSNCLESASMLEEIDSPSVKSFCDEHEIQNTHRMLEGVLIPQRSISTPLIVNTFHLRYHKSVATDSHKQVQHALETLQKKMLMEQHAAALREILFKVQLAQEPLVIPPLVSASNSTQSSVNSGKQEKNVVKDFEEESEVIYGPVEYPLLAMAPPLFGSDFAQKESLLNLPHSSIMLNNIKTSTKNQKVSKLESALLDILSVTRADTQMSDSEASSSHESENSSQALEAKRRKSKKTKAPKVQNKAKEQVKEKTKPKKQRNESLLSPVKSGRRLTERKKNKWQTTENTTGEETKKADKIKVTEESPVKQDESQSQNFFEALRN